MMTTSSAKNQPKELREIGASLINNAENPQIKLIEKASKISSADLRKIFPIGDLIVCDFPVSDIDNRCEFITGVAQQHGILNVDHHLPFKALQRFISSGNLAANYLRAGNAPAKENTPVIINHTDCDSIISSLLMQGILPPIDIFDQAVIAADHTGAQNPIADLLQALDPLRDLNKSIRNLGLLLAGEKLDPECQALYEQRMQSRLRAAEIIAKNAYELHGPLAIVEITGERIGGEILLSHFQNVAVLATVRNIAPDRNEMRLRLCAGAPADFSLHQLEWEKFDPGYGGRWNAGSNRRSNGTDVSKEKYFQNLEAQINHVLNQSQT